jgi:hypothetical protein
MFAWQRNGMMPQSKGFSEAGSRNSFSRVVRGNAKTCTDEEALDHTIHTVVAALNAERNLDPLVKQKISAQARHESLWIQLKHRGVQT